MQKKIIRFAIYIIIFAWIIYQFGIPKYQMINSYKDSQKLYTSIQSDSIEWQKIISTSGNYIYILDIGKSENTTFIIGNIHGDEHGAFSLVLKFAHFIVQNENLLRKRAIIIPTVNPDGLEADTRKNSNGVDLNRNFPSQDWTPVYSDNDNYPGPKPASEKETKLILNLINKYKPEKIITIHSNQSYIEYAGPALELANEMARYNGYRVLKYNGHGTPGSLDTYTGIDLGIPTITLELPPYNPEQAWKDNKDALISAINF